MTDNNTYIQRPMLKKVKRPLNRAPQNPSMPVKHATISEQKPVALHNPFNQEKNSLQKNFSSDEELNLDKLLDSELPEPQKQEVNQHPEFLQEFDENENNNVATALPAYLTKNSLLLLACVILFIGILGGKFIFAESKVVRNGLQGVVFNPEVPRGRARCGVAERSQGCVLYVMNPQRQELVARDFYDLASQMTGRQRFVIETGNMRYSNTKIRPGDIAQLNIPPL
ncbi:MAG: hypothetical protein E7012_01895 [Alphaproteobacteria bacterium]|nr:hypothetical protein [Alphaproteobacteria bacterium]